MQRNKQMRAATYYRLLTLDTARAKDADGARTVPAALSSDAEIRRWYGVEVLEHSAEAVDLSRAAHNGLPLLFGHADRDLIGRIRDIRLEGGKLRGDLHFSQSARASDVWGDVRDGFLTDVSIGYQIHKWREEKSDDDATPTRYVVTRWQPFEASLVSIPADISVGIGRALYDDGSALLEAVQAALTAAAITAGRSALAESVLSQARTLDELRLLAESLDLDFEAAIRAIATETPPQHQPEGTLMLPTNSPEGGDVVAFKSAVAQGRASGLQHGIETERRRLAEVNAIFVLPGVPDTMTMRALRDTAVEQGWTVEKTQAAVLELRAGEGDAGAIGRPGSDTARGIDHGRGPHVIAGADQRDLFRTGAELALCVRAGLFTTQDGTGQVEGYREHVRKARETGYLGMSLRRLAEEALRINNVETRGLDDEELVMRAFTLRAAGHTTSDFTNLLANVANKSILVGWDEQPETWRGLARVGNLSDFRTASRPGLSNFSSLDAIAEDGEIKSGTFTDLAETITLGEYAKKFRITRRVIINDDLNAFAMVPRKMGRAAARKVGDVFWSLVTANAALAQDNVALFHDDHNNLASGGAPPSVPTLNAAFAAMMVQTDPSGAGFVGGEPRFLAAAPSLRGTVLALLKSQYNPAEGATTSFREENIYYQTLTPVIEPRLEVDDAAAWYLFKDPNVFDTFELGFLNGVQEPYMREHEEWDTRGVEYVVGIDVGGAALDFRNVYKDPGD